MNTIGKQKFKDLIGEALQEVVMPHIIELKDDVKVLKDDVADLKMGQIRIERRQIAEQKQIDAYEPRIKELERVTAH